MNIGVAGCAGRMGRMLVAAVLDQGGDVRLAAATEPPGHPDLGQDAAQLAGRPASGVLVNTDAAAMMAACDVVIDFTTPAALLVHAPLAAAHGAALVVGTTGLGGAHEAALDAAAQAVPVVQAANMSLGVNILLGLTRQIAARLGAEYDIEIVEMHHRHKVDAPSGTALALGRAAAEGRAVALDDVAVTARQGVTGPRPDGAIGFATLRGGDVVGEHSVIFAGEGERLEVTHKAQSRTIFARGAVRAALWAAVQAPGRYTMAHVLGLD